MNLSKFTQFFMSLPLQMVSARAGQNAGQAGHHTQLYCFLASGVLLLLCYLRLYYTKQMHAMQISALESASLCEDLRQQSNRTSKQWLAMQMHMICMSSSQGSPAAALAGSKIGLHRSMAL